ncbi:haloacid dehalogenase [Methanothermococcus sp.]|uniref:haloacid dehalogenase n=1 Tax=Methanothermococcus sp. TaxID=2614238 RepID=UPI0025D958C9|nr:haloacid dehalogenase [Methanothermococcus sp.]
MDNAKLIKYFEEKDNLREAILKFSREVVRDCNEYIKHIQKLNKNISFDELTDKLRELNTMVENYDDFKKYLNTPQQEYVEAIVFYNIVFNNKFLEYSEFKENDVKPENYILGLCDVIGELRRMVLESIKNDNVEDAEKYYGFMEKIYEFIMKFDYYHVIDGLRRKQDISRSLLEKTNGDLVNFIENLKLRNEIKKLKTE